MDLETQESHALYAFEEYRLWSSPTRISFNFTWHCTADSTLAFFESSNYWNGHRAQGMVDLRGGFGKYFRGLAMQSFD